MAQAYLLDAAGIPTPATFVFWKKRKALAFARDASYPLFLKFAGGMDRERQQGRVSDEAMFWIGRLFGPGLSLADGLAAALGGAAAVARWRRVKGAGWPAELGDQQALRLQRGYVFSRNLWLGTISIHV